MPQIAVPFTDNVTGSFPENRDAGRVFKEALKNSKVTF